MTYLICKLNATLNKIERVEMVRSEAASLVTLGDREYLFQADSDSDCNALLNDYANCTVSVNSETKRVTSIPHTGDSSCHARFIRDNKWIKRVRPALFRAATTTNMFNN